MSERARPVLEPDTLPVLGALDVLAPLELDVPLSDDVALLLSLLEVPLVPVGVMVLGDVLVAGELVLGCDSCTSPPDVVVVVVLRWMLASPDDGTQLLDVLMLVLVLGVVPVPFAPFVVLSPVKR